MVVRLIETSSGREIWRHEGPLVKEQGADAAVDGASPPADDDLQMPGIVGISPDGRQVGVGPGAFDPVAVPWGTGAIDWSPDGRFIATAGLGGADLWDVRTGAHLDGVFGHAAGLNVLAWSPDSRHLAAGTDDADDVIVWDQVDGRLKEWMTLVSEPTSRGVAHLAYSPDGRRLIAGARDRSGVKVWDMTPPATAEVAILPSIGQYGDVGFTEGGQGLVSVDADGFARVHNLVSGARSGPFGVPVGEHAFDVSPDGRWLVFGSDTWDLATGERHFSFSGPPYGDGASWSDDSQLLAVANGVEGHAIEILDPGGRSLAILPERDGYETAASRFSPDGGRLVTMETIEPDDSPPKSRLTVWDWRQGVVLRTIDTPHAEDLDLDPTGQFAATGFGPVAIWDLETGTRRDLDGFGSSGEVAFSPDGSLLGTTEQSTVRLFDTSTGEEQIVLRGSGGAIARLAFSPDGSLLAASAVDGAHVWTLDPDDLIAIGRRELTRGWTDDECLRYLRREACQP
jgi:WD40 repeat protein